MIRVKDPQKSLKFYQEVLGMSLFRTHEAPSAGFNLYFLGYPGEQGVPQDGKTSDREGLLELTWNYGTEKDENFSYHNGNDQPQGFGHICKISPPQDATRAPILSLVLQAFLWMIWTLLASDSKTSSAIGRRGSRMAGCATSLSCWTPMVTGLRLSRMTDTATNMLFRRTTGTIDSLRM